MSIDSSYQIKSHQSIENELTDWSDEAIVKWLKSNKKNADIAISTLISRHYQLILRRCIFRLGNHHDAEEATQEIVLRFVKNLDQFQHRSKFKTWLNTIIDNYCYSYASKRSRTVISEQMAVMLKDLQQDLVPDPYIAMSEVEMVAQVLSSLPENACQVLNLRFYRDCSLEEISSCLQLSLSAAKARLYRSIELFKQRYKQLDSLSPLTSFS